MTVCDGEEGRWVGEGVRKMTVCDGEEGRGRDELQRGGEGKGRDDGM